jgi:hypothetical protein
MLTYAKPPRNRYYWKALFRDLSHSVTLQISVELNIDHLGLLASNFGKKASTSLGAILRWHSCLSTGIVIASNLFPNISKLAKIIS